MMMITPLGAEGGCHVSVMVVKVLLKACSPVTSPSAGRERTTRVGDNSNVGVGGGKGEEVLIHTVE